MDTRVLFVNVYYIIYFVPIPNYKKRYTGSKIFFCLIWAPLFCSITGYCYNSTGNIIRVTPNRFTRGIIDQHRAGPTATASTGFSCLIVASLLQEQGPHLFRIIFSSNRPASAGAVIIDTECHVNIIFILESNTGIFTAEASKGHQLKMFNV